VAHRPLTGEPLALDLINTRWPDHGHMRDFFDDPASFRAWLSEHGLDGDMSALEPLRYARRAIRRFLEQGERDELNTVFAHGRLRLSMSETGPIEHPELDDEAWRPAWVAAHGLLDLLRTSPPDRVRRCGGPDCVLWFLDISRNGRRRWCSMAGCGNRAKARAHYSRGRS
jgi:predicted RNA-binding Zn ribbon-like protein